MDNLKLTGKTDDNRRSVIKVGDVEIGRDFLVIAGPCSVESEEQVESIAVEVKKSGANMLRGGAYKPRTSPYSFQGLGYKGLEYLKGAGKKVGLPVITEVVDTRDVFLVSEYADVLQIGARNMQNFSLLMEVGRTKKPVMLKRGMNSTIEEWLNCAEYIMKEGNNNVFLCERGIRTIETYTRNTFDLSAVTAAKELTHLPVVTDPSHATGKPSLIGPMCLSSIMAGCDGISVEVHNHPDKALSDGFQALLPEQFDVIMQDIYKTLELRKNLRQGCYKYD